MTDQLRDVYEVANQLGGYVDERTPAELSEFLLRESAEATKLAERLETAEARVADLEKCLQLAAGRLTWCATARPGVQSPKGADLVRSWAAEARSMMPQTDSTEGAPQ